MQTASQLAERLRQLADKGEFDGRLFSDEHNLLNEVADRLTDCGRLREENQRYRRWFGCDSCGEDHPATTMCPPHEMRTTGMAWFKSAIRSAEADNLRLRERVNELEGENETLRSACMAGRALPHVVRMEELHGEPWRQKVNDMLDQIDHALGQKTPSDFAAAALPPAAPQ